MCPWASGEIEGFQRGALLTAQCVLALHGKGVGERTLGWSYPSHWGYARAQNPIAVARTGTQPRAIRTFPFTASCVFSA